MANLPIMRYGEFPKAVQPHLVTWFPDQVEELMCNDQFDTQHLIEHVSTKTKIDPAIAMLERGGVEVARKMLESREKRDNLMTRLIGGFAINTSGQAKLVSKALSVSICDELLNWDHLDDAAGLKIARRATPSNVLLWLTRGVSLDDETVRDLVVDAAGRDTGLLRETDTSGMLAWLCLERPGLRSSLLACLEIDQLQGVVAAGFAGTDEDVLLARLRGVPQHRRDLRVAARALKQPSLSAQGAQQLWDLCAPDAAARVRLAREGACDARSELFCGTPIEQIEDTRTLSVLLSTQMVDEERPFHAVQITQLARNHAVLADERLCAMVMLRTYQEASPGYKRHWLLAAAAHELGEHGVVDWREVYPGANSDVDTWHNGREQRLAKRAEMLANEEEIRSNGRVFSYRTIWSNYEIPAEEFAEMPIDNPRVSPSRIALTAVRDLADALGDGSEEQSLRQWQLALRMLPRHKGTLRQLVTTVKALSETD